MQYVRQGAPLGTLTIIRRHRPAVPRHRPPYDRNSDVTGYAKDYNYDNRLKVQSPPHFLDPVQSAWLASSQSELKQ